MDRVELINEVYKNYDEDTRLTKSRHGQLEFASTMHFIHKHIPNGAKIMEVGAGTGRYSIALAKEGYDMTALELVEHNLEILRENAKGLHNLISLQGDATDLSRFPDQTFDALLVFPLYHLFDPDDQQKAIDEAIRVTKPGGILMFAYISIYQIMYCNYLNEHFSDGMKLNYDSNFNVLHSKEQVFTGFDYQEFESLFANKPIEKLTVAGTDSILEIAERVPGFALSDEDFELFINYHLAVCEKKELLGAQTHLLYICKKR